MKHLKIVFLLLWLGMIPAFAAEDIPSKTILLKREHTTNRPESPSRQFITCVYTQGYLEFSFNYSEYLDVTISNDEIPVWSGTVTQDSPSADIPILYGEHTITCITDGGHIFSGYLNF